MSWGRTSWYRGLALAVMAALVWHHVSRSGSVPTPDRDTLSELLPDATGFQEDNGYGWVGVDASGHRVGVCFDTARIDPVVEGYGGEIHLLAGLDARGRITEVRVLAHRETPAYMQAVLDAGFLERLHGLRPGEIPGVDVVTGATVTCRAIAEDLATAAVAAGTRTLGLDLRPLPTKSGTRGDRFTRLAARLRTGLLVGLLLLALVSLALPGVAFLRHLSLACSFMVIGLLLNVPLGLARLLGLTELHLPSLDHLDGLLLVFALLVPALTGKNVYCSRLCPFRAAMEFGRWLSPWRLRPSPWLVRLLGLVRPGLLVAAVVLFLVADVDEVQSVEPWTSLFHGDSMASWYAGLVILVSALVPGLWCHGLCPTGAALDLVARAGLPSSLPRLAGRLRGLGSGHMATGGPTVRAGVGRPVWGTLSARDVVLLGLLVAIAALGIRQAVHHHEQAPVPGGQEVIPFDRERILEAIERGRLVRHPAAWAKPLGQGPPRPAPDGGGTAPRGEQ